MVFDLYNKLINHVFNQRLFTVVTRFNEYNVLINNIIGIHVQEKQIFTLDYIPLYVLFG